MNVMLESKDHLQKRVYCSYLQCDSALLAISVLILAAVHDRISRSNVQRVADEQPRAVQHSAERFGFSPANTLDVARTMFQATLKLYFCLKRTNSEMLFLRKSLCARRRVGIERHPLLKVVP